MFVQSKSVFIYWETLFVCCIKLMREEMKVLGGFFWGHIMYSPKLYFLSRTSVVRQKHTIHAVITTKNLVL